MQKIDPQAAKIEQILARRNIFQAHNSFFFHKILTFVLQEKFYMMKIQKYILLAITLLVCGTTFAQEKEQNLDSLKAAMNQEDYIHASLLIASPGFEVYSAAGHAALRLNCPSKGVDNTFEFATLIDVNTTIEFISGTTNGGFKRVRTTTYIQRYKDESRGVEELKLNLRPEQELKLWEFLDKECDKGEGWTFDYQSNTCSNMAAWAVESCLLGEQIKYNNVHPKLLGTYRETFALMSDPSPWTAMFWDIMMGTDSDEPSDFKQHLYPKFILSEWQKATIVDTLGNERPLAIGKPTSLLDPTREDKPMPITPIMTFLFLIAWSTVITVIERKCGYTILGRITDIFYFTIQLLVGLFIAYLVAFSTQVATTWNWLIISFNPLAFILWLIFRRKPVMSRLWLLFTIVLIINVCLTPFQPQLIRTQLYLLLLAFAIRTAWMSQLAKK